MPKQNLKRKIFKTFMLGITVFVLIILAGIITGITLIPASLIAFFVGGPGGVVAMSFLGIGIGIYFLGFVFERFKIKLQQK